MIATETDPSAGRAESFSEVVDGSEAPCGGPSGKPACEDSRLRHDARFPDSVSADLGDSIAGDHLSPDGDEPPVY